jgi:hypothetical protein
MYKNKKSSNFKNCSKIKMFKFENYSKIKVFKFVYYLKIKNSLKFENVQIFLK